ncbi:MAG TPA: methylated-DNA--[protein]-cysteine S-methyltransferase [Acidimicrobiia bacterium]|nr:methylated-DNA--[protein]-cysteine S-methyltransferase [Acidimicrobiia bacterium]
MTIDLAVVRFPLGSFRAQVEDGVVRAATFDATPQPVRRDRFGVHDVLSAYFDGEVAALDRLPVKAHGTAFQQEVWQQLRLIPVGTTISYGALAGRVGRPNASRAVGMANASNPIALIVPCHRVIRTGGALGGYAFGLDYKRWLLAHEAPARPLLHGDARDDVAADPREDLVETVARDRQAVIA